jgi:PAS domain-containing protein
VCHRGLLDTSCARSVRCVLREPFLQLLLPAAAVETFDPALLLVFARLGHDNGRGLPLLLRPANDGVAGAETQYRELFESATEGIYELSSEGAFVRANRACSGCSATVQRTNCAR